MDCLSNSNVKQEEATDPVAELSSEPTDAEDKGWFHWYRSQLLEDGLQRMNRANQLMRGTGRSALDDKASQGIGRRLAQSVQSLEFRLTKLMTTPQSTGALPQY
jgi:hypothetical protein